MYGLPAIPRDVRAHPFKDVAVALEIALAYKLFELVELGPASPYSEVASGPDIVSSERVHQIHLGRPGTYPSHGDDVSEHVVIAHSSVAAER